MNNKSISSQIFKGLLTLGAFVWLAIGSLPMEAFAGPASDAATYSFDDGKCGADKKTDGKDAKCDGKCGEGKCDGDKKADATKTEASKDHKCGEGKCGGDKKADASKEAKSGSDKKTEAKKDEKKI